MCFVFIVVLVLTNNNWYQGGDTKALFFWTLPLALSLGIFGSATVYFVKGTNQLLWLLIIAIVVAFAWFYVIGLFWGSVSKPLSFQPFYLWVFGSVAQDLFLHFFYLTQSKSQTFGKYCCNQSHFIRVSYADVCNGDYCYYGDRFNI